MIGKAPSKSGAALVIALGFLAILTVMIIAFSALTRSDRLSSRSYLSSAQTRHLLQTALTAAMLDIDAAANTNYPTFFALESLGDDQADLLSETLTFELSESYFQNNTNGLWQEYLNQRDLAKWETITVLDSGQNRAIGRIGYVVINSSGFLDANAVGGSTSRGAGHSPREIQLSPALLPDLGTSGTLVNDDGAFSAAPDSGYALAHNRDNTWHRFESLRDIWQLNASGRGDIIRNAKDSTTSPIMSFSTFSHSLATNDFGRTFMGTNEATLNLEFIKKELNNIGAVDPQFVLQQLLDYLDVDTLPQDLNDQYSDYSVEPVPMINELALTCNFTYFPTIKTNVDGTGETVREVVLVTVTNSYELELEVWYPFVGYTNDQTFTLSITDTPIESGNIDPDILNPVVNWITDVDIPADECHPDNREFPYDLVAHADGVSTKVTSEGELLDLFETLESNIQFPTIVVTDPNGDLVDQTLNLELPLVDAVSTELMPEMKIIASNLFDAAVSEETSNQFSIAFSCIDPRLNWDGTDVTQWQEQFSAEAAIDTLGELNYTELALIETDDPQDMIYVRNQDRIDSPWEFTYFLYNTSNPWKTFQMLEANDPDNTRAILENLSPFPNGPPKSGRISPFTPYTNVLASVFMDMPIDEFMGTESITRLNEEQAVLAAELFMDQAAWAGNASESTANFDLGELATLMSGESNPWILESYFRNSRELFNPDDTLYTILLAAQSGVDIDDDGLISNDEVRSTQQTIVYVWRDRTTGKAAIVFYGLSDTLQSTIGGGQRWSEILQAFEPQ